MNATLLDPPPTIVASDHGSELAALGRGGTGRQETSLALSEDAGKSSRTLARADSLRDGCEASDGQQRFRACRSRAGDGAKELLRFGLVMERLFDGRDVLDRGDTQALGLESATLVDMVLAELCGRRRQTARRDREFSALEPTGPASSGVGEPSGLCLPT